MLKFSEMIKTKEGDNPPNIFHAASNDDPIELAMALKAGQSLDEVEPSLNGMTPVHYACYSRSRNFLRAALAHDFDPWILDGNGRRSIEIAIIQGLNEFQDALRDKLYPDLAQKASPEIG